jgi:hypothetical protein
LGCWPVCAVRRVTRGAYVESSYWKFTAFAFVVEKKSHSKYSKKAITAIRSISSHLIHTLFLNSNHSK